MSSIDFNQSLHTIVKQIIKNITSSFKPNDTTSPLKPNDITSSLKPNDMTSSLKPYDDCDYIELHPIIETSDMNKMLIAKTILQDAGIHFNVKNENLQNLFAVGQYTTGFNPVIGPMIIEVPKDQCDEARDLLKPLFDQE